MAALKKGLQQAASKTTVARLDGAVVSLGNTVAAFEDLLSRLAESSGRRGRGRARAGSEEPVRSWLRLPQDRAAVEEVLSELLPWMQVTYLRYASARESLPPCWLWHPEIVEELLWLMDAWIAAYEGEEASNRLVGDWHDRQRPGVTRRIGEYAPSCDVLAHRDHAGQPAAVVPLAAEADPFVAWWAAGRDENGPAPTAEQIKAGRRGGLTAVPAAPDTTAGGQR